MLNQSVLVGRIVSTPSLSETDGGKLVSNIVLAVPRSYKNEKGEYDTDFINCKLWQSMAKNTVEYCKKGDLVGIKGRIESSEYEQNGERKKSIDLVAEKITFLSSREKQQENEKQNDEVEEEIEI